MPVPSATHHWTFDTANLSNFDHQDQIGTAPLRINDLLQKIFPQAAPIDYSTTGYLAEAIKMQSDIFVRAKDQLTTSDKTFTYGGWVKWKFGTSDQVVLDWGSSYDQQAYANSFGGCYVGILPTGEVYAKIRY